MINRIICLIFICALIGCEKETLVPSSIDSKIETQESYNSMTLLTNPETNTRISRQNAYLGDWTGDLYDVNEYSNMGIQETRMISCYAELPFFIDGSINSKTSESEIDLWLGLNDAFTGLKGVIDVSWKVNGVLYGSGQKIELSEIVEGELISITSDVYSTDGVYIYLSTLDFDLQVGTKAANSQLIDFSDSGLVLEVINGETVLSDCGLGGGAFTIIVP